MSVFFSCAQENDNRVQTVESIAGFPNVETNTMDDIDANTTFLVSPNDFPSKFKGFIANAIDVIKHEHFFEPSVSNTFYHSYNLEQSDLCT